VHVATTVPPAVLKVFVRETGAVVVRVGAGAGVVAFGLVVVRVGAGAGVETDVGRGVLVVVRVGSGVREGRGEVLVEETVGVVVGGAAIGRLVEVSPIPSPARSTTR
jgi:hypothetical protein